MSRDAMNTNVSGEQLSALLDGEMDAAALARTCAAWRSDPSVREIWHTYHLIGDVLRSDDLAASPQRNAALLRAVRERLAAEPVVLAPAAMPSEGAARRRGLVRSLRRWRAPAAVAAGFVAVAGVLVVMRDSSIAPPPAATVADASTGAQVAQVSSPAEAAQAEDPVTDGRLIRDARLDSYLAAHRQLAGIPVLGVPAAYLRSVTADAAAER